MATWHILSGLAILVSNLFAIAAVGQKQTIKGRVVNQAGTALGGSTVVLQSIGHGTVCNADGTFRLANPISLPDTLVITHVGYQPAIKAFDAENIDIGPLTIMLIEATEALGEVIVTATRTERSIDNIPMPVQLVAEEQIERIGSLRLDEVLQEQTGLQMISDHGAGLQMQGLSSDYILILIDGEPVIGRTAGTVDLSRITVNNIERIEIIRGPSSSLYGSEAMAGVVNIITKDNATGWNGTLGTQYRSFRTWDAQAEVGCRGERLSARVFANRLRSDGYDLTDNTVAQTVAPYQALTFGPKYPTASAINCNYA